MLGVFEYLTGRRSLKERLSMQSPVETDLVFCLLKKEYKFDKYIDKYIVF